MGPAIVPTALMDGPFTFAEAERAGLTRRQLRGASWRRLSFGRYAWTGLKDNPELTLASVHNRLPKGAVFSGRTAAWLHGLDFAPDNPVEVTFPSGRNNARLAGVSVRRASLAAGDLVVLRGLPTTSALRTMFDLGARPPLVEAVVALDMALHDGLIRMSELRDYGSKGAKQFRQAVALAEPLAESPMETRLRMLLVLSGLPRPEAQVSLHDENGRFLGRADLYYASRQLALEYDGSTHRASLVDDNRRQNRLLNAGYRLLRFTFADLREAPTAVVDQVRRALSSTQGVAPRRQAK